jgi:UDPglucose 6-dehydrogenase
MSGLLIGFAGMTHLGVNSAAAALVRGFDVIGYDADADVVDTLSKGAAPVSEPGLEEALLRHRSQSTFTTDVAALSRCDVVYISADVPTDDAGRSDLRGIQGLIETVFPALREQAALVVLCQVPPGFTRALGLPAARAYYQVETLVFGEALERATRPERIIVGCADPGAARHAAYEDFLRAFACPVLPMRYESAELAKIAINCCLVSSISVANTLAELCEGLGAVWSEIVPALKLDRRIGRFAYLSPGLGIAGGNLERDLATVIRFADELGTDAGVVRAWIANSRHRREWAARTIRTVLLDRNPAAVVAVWGLAYKENTASVKNSPSLATIALLQDAVLRLHDPIVAASAARHPRATAAADPLSAVRGTDALMILTPWQHYRDIPPARIAKEMRGRLVIDPYAVLDARAAAEARLEVYALGRPAAPAGHPHA